jgi:hypothetical protein
VGPKAYRVYRSGRRLAVRFFVARHAARVRGGYREVGDAYLVWDMDTGKLAAKTDKNGYTNEEAVRVAREYRNKYGAYVRSAF